jgi:opacity protein-like surface antigen
MPRLHPALAALLAALALLPATAAAAPDARIVPVLHLSAGTGVCAAPRSDTQQNENPCWLQLGVAPGLRVGHLELGLVYEGRELVKLVTFGLVQPPSAPVLGASAGWVFEPSDRWRLLAAAEGGWRRYMDFAGSGVSDRTGAADTTYLGVTGRAALGLRPQTGRADRLEVSVSLRSDLKTAHATVDGVPWSAGGWSFTMGVGLVSEW